MEDNTPQQQLDEVNKRIERLEKSIEVVNNQLLLDNSLLDRLKEQRKSLLNYLNTDEC
jgi:chaperonin cofactor prefoldin